MKVDLAWSRSLFSYGLYLIHMSVHRHCFCSHHADISCPKLKAELQLNFCSSLQTAVFSETWPTFFWKTCCEVNCHCLVHEEFRNVKDNFMYCCILWLDSCYFEQLRRRHHLIWVIYIIYIWFVASVSAFLRILQNIFFPPCAEILQYLSAAFQFV